MKRVMQNVKNLEHYFFNVVIIWCAIIFFRTNTFYSRFLRSDTQSILLVIAIAYSILGLAYYLYIPPSKNTQSKGSLIARAISRTSHDSAKYLAFLFSKKKHPLPKISKQEKTAFLFIAVKVFFLPLMLNFFLNNYFAIKNSIVNNAANIHSLFTIAGFNGSLFPLLLSAIFLFDTAWFAFGYLFESKRLKNTVRSVEPTVLGWVAALICYPPFNGMLTGYVNWYANDYIIFFNDGFTFVMRICILLLLGIYLSATFALGAKCSNLTNRGIVSRGPYKYVRHPAYIAKNTAWWLTLIPIFSWAAVLSMSVWSTIYHVRAVTEERHLSNDPDYREYKKKVKYRYIPFVY